MARFQSPPRPAFPLWHQMVTNNLLRSNNSAIDPCALVKTPHKAHAFAMTPLTNAERTHSLTRIAGALDRQRDEATRAGSDLLAYLIGRAMEEATSQLSESKELVA
jgi:hypothetical protein